MLIASLAKSFTADAVLTLVHAHRVALNDRLDRYVDWYPAGANATIAQLLDQTSGIPDYAQLPGFNPSSAANAQDLLRPIQSLALDFPPGTAFAYSNSNYVLLGAVIERASATPYASFVQRIIVDPLHLRATRFVEHSALLGAGAFASSADDIVTWIDAVLKGRTAIARPLEPPYADGFFIGKMYGRTVYYHAGYATGSSAFMLVAPDSHFEAALTADAPRIDLQPLARSIFAAFEPPVDGLIANIENGRFVSRTLSRAAIDGALRALNGAGYATAVTLLARAWSRTGTHDTYAVHFESGAGRRVRVGYDAIGMLRSLTISA